MSVGLETIPWLDNRKVAVWRAGAASYPAEPPYHPSERYPELGGGQTSEEPNHVYAAVRGALVGLGLDAERSGTAKWNPLGGLIQPGDRVVVKPNWLRAPRPGEESEECVITHPAVLRVIVDYVLLALRGLGSVIIADGPQIDSDFEGIRAWGLDALIDYYQNRRSDVHILDLRQRRWILRDEVIEKRISLPGDPAGYSEVDLGRASAFAAYRLSGRFYGADYDTNETADFHANGSHRYILCRTIADADVVINVPKLKTHKKVGVTLSLKAMVGINGNRNCLPHHTTGTPAEGGDEFAISSLSTHWQSSLTLGFKKALARQGGTGGQLARTVKGAGKRIFGKTSSVVRQGNWYGNDTAWRMVLDLNRALLHYDSTGARRLRPLRYMSIIDGIVGGDGNGPSSPQPVRSGVIVAGFNPVAVDTVGATMMGFRIPPIRMIEAAWDAAHELPLTSFALDEIDCVSNEKSWTGPIAKLGGAKPFHFKPHFGWVGHLEAPAPQAV